MTAPDSGRESADRLERYERRTDGPLLVLSLCFIAVYAAEVAAPGLPAWLRAALAVVSWIIWGLFAVDLVTRVRAQPSMFPIRSDARRRRASSGSGLTA